MAFQIAYTFKAIDRFTKVAAKIEKSIDKIEKKVGLATRKFYKLGKRGERALSKIDKKTVLATGKLDKLGKVGENAFSKISSKTPQVVDGFEKIGRKGKKANIMMRFMSATAGSLKFRLASLAVTAITTGFGFTRIIDRAAKIEKSFKIMEALTGISGKNLEFLRDEAFKLSQVMGMPAEEIFTAFKRVAGLKPELLKDVHALRELTKWTLILDAPMEQIEKVARALVISLNVYGKTVKNAAEFSNILAAAQRKGSAEVIDLAMSFLKAGKVAETAQIPFIDLISVMEGLAQAGILGRMAGTSIRTVLIRLAKIPKQFRGETIVETLVNVQKHIENLPPGFDRIAEASKMFGIRQATAGLAIAENADLIRKLREEIEGTNIAFDTAKTVLSTYERQSLKIWAVVEEYMFDVFEQIKPALLELKTQWVIFLRALGTALPGGIKGTFNVILQLTTDILETINAILLGIAVIKSPFGFVYGLVAGGKEGRWAEGMKGFEDVGKLWDLMMKERPTLETLIKPGEIKGAAGATGGKVSVDLNLRGNTEAVSSVQTRSEGDVEFNTGANLAFIG